MSPEFTGRVPTLWHGRGVARQVVERLVAGREALVIADSAMTSIPLRSTRTMRLDVLSTDVTTVETIAREILRFRPEVIVAVGGGTVLDAVKIAALGAGDNRMLDYVIAHATRSALTMVPDAAPPMDVIAVPTTLGTSSETNSVGILRNDIGYRLVIGRALRPRHAVIDADNLLSLPCAAVREGALEVLLRLAGAETSALRNARARSDAVAIGRALLDAGDLDCASPRARLRLARLSAATQRTAALRGADPFSARHWYVANEVAFALGVRKMVATAAIIAEVWSRIDAGDTRWGDRKALREYWAQLACGAALPRDPPSGIAALIQRWAIARPPEPTAHDLRRISVATQAAWGDRLPMLRQLAAVDIRDVLRDSRWSHQQVGSMRRPMTFDAEEVKFT